MASVYGSTISSKWRAYIDYSASSDNTTTTLTISGAGFQQISWRFDIDHVDYTLSGTGQTSKSGKNRGVHTSSSTTIKTSFTSATWSWGRGHSAATKTISMKVYNHSGYLNGTSTATLTLTIPAKPSYSVTYNANGGSGAPGAQTKWYGETLTLSTTAPTRVGYTFLGWSTSSTATAATYQPGGSYTANSGTVLYAVWQLITYPVTFYANGGDTVPAAQTKTYNVDLTITSELPTRTDYDFLGWSTTADGMVAYQPGDLYTSNAALDLYAQWKESYIKPTISDFTVTRVTSTGTQDDAGTYANISFNWAVDTEHATVQSFTVEAKPRTQQIYNQIYTAALSGASGNINLAAVAYPTTGFQTDITYDLRVTVTDDVNSSTVTNFLSTAFFTMDFLAGGHGIAIGAPATQDGFFIAMETSLLDLNGNEAIGLDRTGNITATGEVSGENVKLSMEYGGIDADGHATTGADKDLYNLLVDLGWDSDVIV